MQQLLYIWNGFSERIFSGNTFPGSGHLQSLFLKKISDIKQNTAASPPHQIRERIRLFISIEVPRKALRMDSIIGVMG